MDIDDACFNCAPEVDYHLPRSYEIRLGVDFRWTHNSAHVYDAALAVIAHLARGTPDDLTRARLIIHTSTAASAMTVRCMVSYAMPTAPGRPPIIALMIDTACTRAPRRVFLTPVPPLIGSR